MEIATEAVNTLKLSLLNLDIYLLSIQPSKQMFSLPQSTTELFLADPAADKLIPLFPAGHPGPERDNNSHNQSVQTLRHCSLIRLLDINKNYIILHEVKTPASLLLTDPSPLSSFHFGKNMKFLITHYKLCYPHRQWKQSPRNFIINSTSLYLKTNLSVGQNNLST